MTNLNNLELVNKPNKAEIFITLAENLLLEIQWFRENQGLDSQHLDIINLSVLNLLNPNGNHLDYFSKLENKQLLLSSTYQGLMTMIGWEVYLRLSKETQASLSNSTQRADQTDLRHLIISYSQVFCDSELCLKYFQKLATRNCQFLNSYLSSIKTNLSELNSPMQLPMLEFNLLQSKIQYIRTQKKHQVLSCLPLYPRTFLKKLPSIIEYSFEHLYQSTEFINVTSELLSEQSLLNVFRDFIKIYQSLETNKDFDLNQVKSIQMMHSGVIEVVLSLTKNNNPWLDAMIDSLIFDLQVESHQDWQTRLRKTKSQIDILLPAFSESTYSLDLQETTFQQSEIEALLQKSNLDEQETNGQRSEIETLLQTSNLFQLVNKSYTTAHGNLYKTPSGLSFLVNDKISIGKLHPNNMYTEYATYQSIAGFESTWVKSEYVSVLRVLSGFITNSCTQTNPLLTDVNKDLLNALVANRLEYLIFNAYNFDYDRSAQLSFFQQTFASFNNWPLLQLNMRDKEQYFTEFLKLNSPNTNPGKLSDLILSISKSNVYSKFFSRVQQMEGLILIKMLGLNKKVFSKEICRYLNSLDDSEILEFLDILSDQNLFHDTLIQQHDEFELMDFQQKIQYLLSCNTYQGFIENLGLVKKLHSQHFEKFLEDSETALLLTNYLQEITQSYNQFIDSANEEQYKQYKPLGYMYIKQLIQNLRIYGHITQDDAKKWCDSVDAIYIRATEKFSISQKYFFRSKAIIAEQSGYKPVTLRYKSDIRYYMINAVFLFLWNKSSNGEQTSKDVFRTAFERLEIADKELILNMCYEQDLLRSLFLHLIDVQMDSSEMAFEFILNKFVSSLANVNIQTIRNRTIINMIRRTGLDIIYSIESQIFDDVKQEAINSICVNVELTTDRAKLLVIVEELIKNSFKYSRTDVSVDSIFAYLLDN